MDTADKVKALRKALETAQQLARELANELQGSAHATAFQVRVIINDAQRAVEAIKIEE